MRFISLLLVALAISSCRTAPETVAARKAPAIIPPTSDGYKKVVEDQLGPFWYRLVEENLDSVSVGTVKSTFEIPAAGGRARNLKIISNTGAPWDERIVRAAVGQLRAPPIPAAILQAVRNDHLVLDESFTILQR